MPSATYPLGGKTTRFILKERAIVISTIGMAMLFLPGLASNVYAATTSSASDITITTDKPNYVGNATIIVSGIVPEAKDFAVTVTITSPGGAVIATGEQTADEDTGGFTVSFTAGGAKWNQAGTYMATVIYPGQTFIFGSTTFTYQPVAQVTAQTTSSSSPSSTLLLPSVALAGVLIIALLFLALRRRSGTISSSRASRS